MNIYVWIGQFGDAAPCDYFDEIYSEDDDQPISKFVGEQGGIWLDHDWMELYEYENSISIEQLIKNLRESLKDNIRTKAHNLKIAEGNVLVTVLDKTKIDAPRSVYRNEYKLHYIGLFDNTPEKVSIEQLTQKANQGDSRSQSMLGQLYLFPPPEMKDIFDPVKSEYWLLKAAEQGETSTYNRLYHLYSQYLKSNLDLKKAAYWIEKAAMEGNATNQYYVAVCYEKGEGVAVDNVIAMKWYFLWACQNNRSQCLETIEKLKLKLSSAELLQAENSAMEWVEKFGGVKQQFSGLVRNPLRGEK